jgi:hypothetical protein
MRKDDGTMPLAAPECTPSVKTRTVRLPITMPRSDVVSHSWSKLPLPESRQTTRSGVPIRAARWSI